jgi:antitoxin HicB
MVHIRTYSLTIEPAEDGGYLAYFPALPGCHTWGATYEEAVTNAEEALAVYVETLSAHGDPLPDEPEPDRSVTLGVMVRTPIVA